VAPALPGPLHPTSTTPSHVFHAGFGARVPYGESQYKRNEARAGAVIAAAQPPRIFLNVCDKIDHTAMQRRLATLGAALLLSVFLYREIGSAVEKHREVRQLQQQNEQLRRQVQAIRERLYGPKPVLCADEAGFVRPPSTSVGCGAPVLRPEQFALRTSSTTARN
jgi:hypothetical protein